MIETQTGYQRRRTRAPNRRDGASGEARRGPQSDRASAGRHALIRGQGISLDPGELDLWAHAITRNDAWILCGPDIASLRFGLRLGVRDRLVSLEGLLEAHQAETSELRLGARAEGALRQDQDDRRPRVADNGSRERVRTAARRWSAARNPRAHVHLQAGRRHRRDGPRRHRLSDQQAQERSSLLCRRRVCLSGAAGAHLRARVLRSARSLRRRCSRLRSPSR